MKRLDLHILNVSIINEKVFVLNVWDLKYVSIRSVDIVVLTVEGVVFVIMGRFDPIVRIVEVLRYEHNRIKQICVECVGSGICEHKKRRRRCVDCMGSEICEHKKNRTNCVECIGSSICEHKKYKRRCLECKGREVCEHLKQRRRCKVCDGRDLCKSPLCDVRGIKRYNGYCLRCCIYNCPDIPVVNNYKTKENEVVSRIKENYPEFDWVHDKKVESGCSKRRPDLMCDFGSHIIIIEIDENKHSEYDCSCENKQLMELSLDLSHRPIVFIRFNPDGYISSDGKVIKSCWSLNSLGVLRVSSKKKSEWESRLVCLNEQIKYWIENPSLKTIEIVELFY